MTNRIKERNEIEEQYKWDLSSLFKSDDDFESADFDPFPPDVPVFE